MYQKVTNTYQQANVLTANPAKLVIMCYEEAISNVKLSRDAYIARDYEAKGKALLKALDIIHELNTSLDMERGGEIAKNLRALYLYITQALIEADLKKNLTVFDAVIRMLEELEFAWREIVFGKPGSTSPSPTVMPYEAKKTSMVSGVRSA